MESYVVRIYRRNSNSPRDLVGLVELVDTDEEKVFESFEELRDILGRRRVRRPGREESTEQRERADEKRKKGDAI